MIYNLVECLAGLDGTIKTDSIFRTISEVTEALALNSEPGRLLDTVLDTLSRRLNADGSWVQLPAAGGKLRLAASHGLTPELQAGLAAMSLEHPFGQEVIGTGNSVVIPDLARNGHYDLSLFTTAGFRSLLCVPIMTYRVHGIMGTGYRRRKRFNQDNTALLSAIAGLTGVALTRGVRKTARPPEPAPGKITGTLTPQNAAVYKEHQRLMRSFRQAHRPL